jgi:hypothetical protein
MNQTLGACLVRWAQNPMAKQGIRAGYFFWDVSGNHSLHAMKTRKSSVFSLIFLAMAFGCAENKTAKTENPSVYVSTTAVTNAPPDQRLTPTSDRPDAQPHIYSNSTSRAVSPSSTENP